MQNTAETQNLETNKTNEQLTLPKKKTIEKVTSALILIEKKYQNTEEFQWISAIMFGFFSSLDHFVYV